MNTCKQCHVKFEPKKNSKGMYCSSLCFVNFVKIKGTRKCDNCEKSFSLEGKGKNRKKFCSHTCAASYNNRMFPKRFNKDKIRNCLKCEKDLNSNQKSFCSRKCAGEYRNSKSIEDWLQGLSSGSGKDRVLRGICRDYLIKESGYKCSVKSCGWGIPNPITGIPILAVEHKDGDWTNNNYNNLQVLCYNCHTLTTTFGALNKNVHKGRPMGVPRGQKVKTLEEDI